MFSLLESAKFNTREQVSEKSHVRLGRGLYRKLVCVAVLGGTRVEDEDLGRSAPFYFYLIMKKFFTLIVLCVFSIGTIHAKITWSLSDDGTLTISGTDMPNYYNHSPWYKNRGKIKRVIIEEGVTSISSYAFNDCNNLTNVTIPNSVTSIESFAFSGCQSLRYITIPNTVMYIGNEAFNDTKWYYNQPYGPIYIGHILYKYKEGYIPANTNIVVKEGTTLIVGSAFSGCSGLTSITIPESVINIGEKTFEGCSGLTSIIVQQGNTKYDSRSNCNAIIDKESNTLIAGCKNSVIPNFVTSIGNSAFSGCTGLVSITIPNSVTSIGNSAFSGCTGLVSITIPNSVTSIGNSAFYGCTGLISITIPNSLTSIAGFAFSGCSSLSSITIPNSVTSIQYNAFEGCSGLSSVTIPNSVTSIGDRAFEKCTSLASLTIGMKKIENTFRGFKALTSVTLIDGVESIGNSAFSGCSGLTSLIIPNSVTSIGSLAFSNCSGLTSITIPNSVTSIGSDAFRNCLGLISVTIGNSVTRIEELTFYGCKLQTLTIGTDVTYIGSNNSKPCKVIWLPNTPPSGYENVSGNINYVSNENYSNIQNTRVYKHLSSIFEVDGIKYVPVSPSERTCDAIDCNYDKAIENIKINDVVSYKNIGLTVLNVNSYTCYGNEFIKTLNINNSGKIDERAFEGCKNITSVEFGNKITSIGDYAFYGCIAIKEIKIPNSVTSVGAYGFSGCRLLKKVVFGDCPTTIGANAFKDCSSLTELNLGKKVKVIGNYTFANCSSLTKISIPQTTTSIGDYAFSGCKALADVTIEDRTKSISLGSNGSSPLFADCPISSVYLGGKLSYNTSSNSGYSPFYRNKSLQSVVITDTEEQIYDNEFYGCTNLKSVKIGNGVKSIGNWAFSGCANLESFSFGKSMQNIGNEAFSDCTNMKNITSFAATAPKCGSQALDDIDKWSCVLAVPYSSIASYQNADQWKEFFFIQETEPDNQTIANAVIAKITAIGKVEYTDACKGKIDEANKAYNALTADQKVLVTNLEVLTKAQQTYETLKAAAEKLAADKAKADAVIAKITAIGKVEYTDACKGKIDAVNKAYNALTADQKALVTNLDVLNKAQQTYETLKAAAEKLIADKAAFDKYKSEIVAIIEALVKDDDSDAVKEIIRKAISDIESLEYEEAISIDDNKAKVQSFVTSVNEAVENQRAEDQKTNGIEELEFAEKVNIYDLNGRKITNSMLKSGLYIRNGKKVVVK